MSRDLNEREQLIMHEAFMVGRIYAANGEKEDPSEIYTKLQTSCQNAADRYDATLEGAVVTLHEEFAKIKKIITNQMKGDFMKLQSKINQWLHTLQGAFWPLPVLLLAIVLAYAADVVQDAVMIAKAINPSDCIPKDLEVIWHAAKYIHVVFAVITGAILVVGFVARQWYEVLLFAVVGFVAGNGLWWLLFEPLKAYFRGIF